MQPIQTNQVAESLLPPPVAVLFLPPLTKPSVPEPVKPLGWIEFSDEWEDTPPARGTALDDC